MKKLLFSAVSALAIAGVAVAAGSTEFGVLYVPSTAKETIVSVPWIESGTGNDVTNNAVNVADLVLTAGLEAAHDSYAGDELRYYTASGYQVWHLVADQQSGVKSWVAGNVVADDKVAKTADADTTKVMRGQAIILKRANPGAGFHIMGKPSSATGNVKLNVGYTLIAPPSVAATNPNSLKWNGINGKTDAILVPKDDGSIISLGYKASGAFKDKWVKWNGTAWEDPGDCISAGKGVWFTTKESVDNKSVGW